MTQDDIIEMAIQLGFDERLSNNWLVSEDQLMRFSKLVAAKEREACAAICDEETNQQSIGGNSWWATTNCAEAIRARGEA